MKGVLLAGGNGTRLSPLTKVTNKHLLPVYDRPLIYHALDAMVQAGIDRIMIVTSPTHVNDFVDLLGSGSEWTSPKTNERIQIVYGIQDQPTGISVGLWIAKDYVGTESCMVYLGDNIIEDDLRPYVENFKSGATVFLKEVSDPERFGVATLDKNGCITNIEEKPTQPKSNFAVAGVYIYDKTVFKKMLGQKPSERGEYEISYINDLYCKEGCLNSAILEKPWFDAGTFDSLFEASNYMKQKTSE